LPYRAPVWQQNYARKDDACVARVKALYAELNLEQVYKDYEEESYARLLQLIKDHAGSLPTAIFTDFAAKIYKRTK
jgi:farnesyl diphosphate synthase